MKKKNIVMMMCATALLSSCHIYKAYDRPEDISAEGIYRDPVSVTDTLAVTDTTNIGSLPWQEIFRDPKLQVLIEEGLANNVDNQPVCRSCLLSTLLLRALLLQWEIAIGEKHIQLHWLPAGKWICLVNC